MGRYKQPRQLNLVSFLLLVLVIAAAYGAWKFGPPYLRMFRVKEALGHAASAFLARPDADLYGLRARTEQHIRDTGIEDASVRVDFKSNGGGWVTVTASYQEIVRHPWVHKVTVLRFSPAVTREKQRGYP